MLESQEPRHKKPHIKNYRIYESDFEKAKAILSVQERKVGDDIVYFLKLKSLQPSDKSTSAIGKSQDLDLAVDNRASADTLPSAKTADIIPQK